MGLADELLQAATRDFQVYKELNASCPKCKAQMVLKFASNPKAHYGRKLSVIVCCGKGCDRRSWGSNDEEKQFTHWWLDGGSRNLECLKTILDSVTHEEAELLLELTTEVISMNRMSSNSHADGGQQ